MNVVQALQRRINHTGWAPGKQKTLDESLLEYIFALQKQIRRMEPDYEAAMEIRCPRQGSF